MKWLLSFALVFILTVMACKSAKNVAADVPLTGGWELVIFPSEGKEYAEIFGQRKPELQFDELNKKVTGTSGCNHISGGYIHNEKMLQFRDNMIMTKMACPGYDETIFMDALRKVNSYQLSNDQLSLMHDDTVLMIFAKKKL
jgi:heat shock protein HslJ